MGLNKNNLIRIKTNKKGSMDVNHLKKLSINVLMKKKKSFASLQLLVQQ